MQTLAQYLLQHDLSGKPVVLREDFNVKIEGGKILSDARLKAAIPSIQQLKNAKASILLLSHLGRPSEGMLDAAYSLAPVAERLSQLLHSPVRFVKDWIEGVKVEPGEIVLLENVRFLVGEENNTPALAKKIARLGDVFVMDAFAVAHRAQASTVGAIQYAKTAVAGPLFMAEIEALNLALQKPKHPVVTIVGGAKVSDKIAVLEHLLMLSDTLIVGGGIANTFLAAQGHFVGNSLYEPDQIAVVKALMKKAKEKKRRIIVPTDVVVASSLSQQAVPAIKGVHEIKPQDKILDIGPYTTTHYSGILSEAKTVIWNGPLGVFEYPAFAQGTLLVAKMVADSDAYSLVGGGETLAAIEKAKVTDYISYLSTGGGAFLAYCEGKSLPAIEALKEKKE
jgi:phosphoglycerate kinase